MEANLGAKWISEMKENLNQASTQAKQQGPPRLPDGRVIMEVQRFPGHGMRVEDRKTPRAMSIEEIKRKSVGIH